MSLRDGWQKLIEDNISSKQELGRKPEPDAITSAWDNVNEYSKVIETNMMANYATGLDLVHRIREDISEGRLLDICCGPGHQTIFLNRYLGYSESTAIDLSQPMVEVANRNFREEGLSEKIQADVADATDLKYAEGQFDLAFFANSAHHFPILEMVSQVLENADKMVADSGLVILTDLGRLKTAEITERFVQLAGQDFLTHDMPNMFEDFRNSMHAAWLPQELSQTIPKSSQRKWVHIQPLGLTSFQAIIGLPIGREEIFLRDSYDWANSGILKSDHAVADWEAMKMVISNSEYVEFPAKKVAA